MIRPLAIGLSLAALLRTQDPTVPQATFRTGIDLIQVDVSVLDKDRHPVRGLTTCSDSSGRTVPRTAAFIPSVCA